MKNFPAIKSRRAIMIGANTHSSPPLYDAFKSVAVPFPIRLDGARARIR
jgi:hypothetical protein